MSMFFKVPDPEHDKTLLNIHSAIVSDYLQSEANDLDSTDNYAITSSVLSIVNEMQACKITTHNLCPIWQITIDENKKYWLLKRG